MANLLLSTSTHLLQKPGLEGGVPWFELLSAWLWSIYLMVQWCSNSYWWFPGVCEMSQPSWGGGPTGSPPHARMTSSFQPLMQLLLFLMISASATCSSFSISMYQLDFASPSLCIGGIWVVFVSHVLQYYCISPGCYSRHRMYVGFIILFSGSYLCKHVLYSSVPCLLNILFFCTLSRRA